MLLGKKRKKKVIVLLCTGNTCRGPMAQGYMRKAMEERGIKDVDVKTAGVMTIPGLIPTPEACQVMKNADIDITGHRSSPLTPELIRKADLILGMTPFHVQFALRMSDDAKGKTYLLKEYAESDMKNYQITDPMGATLEVYKRVYREMKLAIDKMIESKEVFTGVPEEDLKKRKKAVPAAVAAAPPRKSGVSSSPKAAAGKVAAPVKPAAKPKKKEEGEAPAETKAKKAAPPKKIAPKKPAAPASAKAGRR